MVKRIFKIKFYWQNDCFISWCQQFYENGHADNNLFVVFFPWGMVHFLGLLLLFFFEIRDITDCICPEKYVFVVSLSDGCGSKYFTFIIILMRNGWSDFCSLGGLTFSIRTTWDNTRLGYAFTLSVFVESIFAKPTFSSIWEILLFLFSNTKQKQQIRQVIIAWFLKSFRRKLTNRFIS